MTERAWITDSEEAAKVRAAAQEAWGEESNHVDVRVMDDEAPERVEHGYWVKARLWVPDEWVEGR